jgi:hypothetical protein
MSEPFYLGRLFDLKAWLFSAALWYCHQQPDRTRFMGYRPGRRGIYR